MNLVVKTKLSPQSGSCYETVEPNSQIGVIKLYIYIYIYIYIYLFTDMTKY